jgi:CheY-like chemotaxis protein
MPQGRSTRSAGSGGARPNTLNLDREALTPVLDSMDLFWVGPQAERALRRGYVRWPFRRETLELRIKHPGGTKSVIQVACRNISRNGLSVLHSTFIHPGTACTALVPQPKVGLLPMDGTIVRCDHRSGIIHEVGVSFDREVDVRAFITHDPFGDFFSMERVEPQRLAGRVVCIDGAAVEQRFIAHLLRESRVTLLPAETAREGMAMAEAECDLLLCDLHLRDGTALEVIAALRAAGIKVPSIIMTSQKDAALRKALGELHVDAFLLKPPDASMLMRALGEYLIVRRGEPAEPQVPPKPKPKGLFELTVASMALAAAELEEALLRDNLPAVRAVCERIGSAGSAGAFASARLLAMEAAYALACKEAPVKRGT